MLPNPPILFAAVISGVTRTLTKASITLEEEKQVRHSTSQGKLHVSHAPKITYSLSQDLVDSSEFGMSCKQVKVNKKLDREMKWKTRQKDSKPLCTQIDPKNTKLFLRP